MRRDASAPGSMRTVALDSGTGGVRPAWRQAASSASETCRVARSSALSSSKGTTTCKAAPGGETTRACPSRAASAPVAPAPSARTRAHERACERRAGCRGRKVERIFMRIPWSERMAGKCRGKV
ncbi:Uncharacterised protein [Bordetella pertussis]|nr:Uncharacterised protein [Bordetella pertussis]